MRRNQVPNGAEYTIRPEKSEYLAFLNLKRDVVYRCKIVEPFHKVRYGNDVVIDYAGIHLCSFLQDVIPVFIMGQPYTRKYV